MKNILLAFFALLAINTSFSQNRESELANAISSNNLKLVKKLVEKEGADVNAVWKINEGIYLPLLVKAAMEDRTEVASYLIEKGADVNRADGFGMTSLMWAANNNNVALVKLLLAKGADKNAQPMA